MNYNTPIYDKCLVNLGWVKFENNPIYIQKLTPEWGQNEKWKFIISFNADFHGQQEIYENMLYKGIAFEQLENMLKSSFTKGTANTFVETLSYEVLLMLTADFYYHNSDKENHYKYKQLYEQLSSKKY